MKDLKFLMVAILFVVLGFGVVGEVRASKEVVIDFYHSKTCPHCIKEKPFLMDLAERYDGVSLNMYEVSEAENMALWREAGEKLGAKIGGVPFTVIGEKYFTGFDEVESTGAEIENLVVELLGEERVKASEDMVKLPFVGRVNWKTMSLPLLTFLVALLDGFNPCAMWDLLFLISLLLGMKGRRRMWILGSVFILTSGVVYFAIMAAWLNVFLWLGLVSWARVAIGLLAVGAGGFSLKSWYSGRGGGCETEDSARKMRMFERLKLAVSNKRLVFAVLGIMGLALAVNVVEMTCSAGLPAIYTKALAMNELSRVQYYLYLLFYILIFMLDDLVVFIVAMTTLKAVGVDSKYASWSRLVGGLVMLWIGYAMLFNPGSLSF